MAYPKGAPKVGGRQKGTPNKATADLKALAREYTEDALSALAEVVNDKGHPARVAAAKEIFDRAYGKATQFIELDGEIEVKHIKVSFE